jgi:hypothetical protein
MRRLLLPVGTRSNLMTPLGSPMWFATAPYATSTKKKPGQVITKNAILKFLKNKGIGASWGPAVRTAQFRYLLNPSSAGNAAERYRKCRDRLERLVVSTGDSVRDTVPSDVQSFTAFVSTNPQWGQDPNVYVFFRDHLKFASKSVLVQRLQRSGLCYIHGPDVMQHYLVALCDPTAGMIDMSSLIKDSFTGNDLERHIFEDYGGSSLGMLKHILMPNSFVFASDPMMWEQGLKDYGPGLVSHFEVHPDFRKVALSSHHGPVTKRAQQPGMQAMVLVGSRDVSGKKYFLLQNWWKQKQFLEVDIDYMKSCNATVSFVETPQTEIPSQFSTQHSIFAESELDKREQYMFEDFPPIKLIESIPTHRRSLHHPK